MREVRIRRTRAGQGRRTPGAGACAILLFLWIIPVLVGAQQMPSPPPATVSPARTPRPAPLSAAQDLDSFAQAWASIAAYSATVTVFERKGTQVENLVLNYSFRKPSSVMVHVVSGPNAGGTLTGTVGRP
jgi:hypothetical protein